MAMSRISSVAQNVDTLKILTCPVCLGEFNDPLIIDCHHSFCRTCIAQWIRHNRDEHGNFKCPVCKYKNGIPLNGVSGFQKSFYVEQFKDILKLEQNNYPMCKRHPIEDLRFFCQKCDSAVCRDCKVLFHEGHKAEVIPDVSKEMCISLKQRSEESELEYSVVEKAKRRYEEDRNRIRKLKLKAINGIRTQAKEMKNTIDNLTRELERKVANNFQNFEDVIERDIADTYKKLQSLIAFQASVKLLIETGSDHNIIDGYKGLLERCGARPEEAIPSWYNPHRSLEKLENVYHSGQVCTDQMTCMLGSVEDPTKTPDEENPFTVSEINNLTFKGMSTERLSRMFQSTFQKSN